jgi:hypothetical protein
MRQQYDDVRKWLREHGFERGPNRIQKTALERALAPFLANIGPLPAPDNSVSIASDLAMGRRKQSPTAVLTPQARRGPKPKYDWDAVKRRAFDLLNSRGDYESAPTRGWARQADLETALLEFMNERFGREAAISTLRRQDKIPAWVHEWRELRKREVSKGQ